MDRRLSNEKSLEIPRDNEWVLGMCNCCSHPLDWCFACWCPCLVYKDILQIRNTQQHNNANSDQEELKDMHQDTSTHPWLSCCLWTVLTYTCCLGPFFSANDRGHIRKDHAIDGSYCGDVCVHCCCLPCGLVQEKHQLTDPDAQKHRHKNLEKVQRRSSAELQALNNPDSISPPPPPYMDA
jgi:Cys-rich protein (TIGR01571 family)